MTEKKPGIIRRSFGFLGRLISWLRVIIVNGVFVLMLLFVISLFSSKKMPSIPEQGALILEPKGTVVEQLSYIDPLMNLMADNNPREQETLLADMIDAILLAKDDQRINSLVIKTDYLMRGGLSKLQEVAAALAEFRKSGKKIVAVADYYSQDQYLLAAQADEIYMHPMGGVAIQGYGLYRSYYKEALDKLSVDFHVFRVGEFKSALEPFMRNNMSEPAKEANLGWLNQLWQQYSNAIAQRRGLELVDINTYVNEIDKLLARHNGDSAQAAVAAGLVDGLKSRDEINQTLIELAGGENDEGSFQGIAFERYLWLKKHELKKQQSKNVVGVIVAAGNISGGKQPPGSIGSDTLSELIRQARKNDAVKAVVLRVDSGGGSAFASELIRRELELLKASGKPLVVSMGSMAASGGYWISSLADFIWATPTTLTGSIGIFGAFPTLDKSFNRLGIYNDGVGTTAVADAFRVDRPMNPIAARAIQKNIEHGYQQFLSIVAQGRDMSEEQVADIAEGRVWSGQDAERLGLVDGLGGLKQAIDSAAKLASLSDYRDQLIERPLSPKEQLLRQLGQVLVQPLQGVLSPVLPSQLQQLMAPFKEASQFLQSMSDPAGLYVRCTDCLAP
ncbi:signal peptide peptidase SppA [Dasania sp. GY-MA-18]|uniref:Signal peptide peptidase SppA n=1 Tax=Dasania phycosphaerae TaxID=2950436 RepID=A0A9J6RQH6_9GAMM|nr:MULTISPECIES: signal peptide peptidase SppA [Dasania]MCR8923949.1 signal peptide peptidase SppA [Dasania sp. GY-MA-18]MCZ0866383.1 signal peptide peptidase SppA [Dasania phycosphaerae]MCZ0870107.1 signal peptide peptidase SppA [Dasania phycosphaerae]